MSLNEGEDNIDDVEGKVFIGKFIDYFIVMIKFYFMMFL